MAGFERHRECLDELPIGRDIAFEAEGIPGSEILPFEGNLTVKRLDPAELPEPPRAGEGDRPCHTCSRPDDQIVWSDEDWIVTHLGEPSAIPVTVTLSPRAHFDLLDMPPALAASMGPMLIRLAAAIEAVPGVGQAHLNKWGDGGSHLHWCALGRPAGMQQLRGSCLVIWDGVLPKIPSSMWQANLEVVAAHLASSAG